MMQKTTIRGLAHGFTQDSPSKHLANERWTAGGGPLSFASVEYCRPARRDRRGESVARRAETTPLEEERTW
jgi:hypothetical protein